MPDPEKDDQETPQPPDQEQPPAPEEEPPAQEPPSPETEETKTEARGPNGWIPKVRFDEVNNERKALAEQVQREREERIRAEERAKLTQQQQAKPEKEYTRQELRQMVDTGRITQDAMDEYLDTQLQKRITREAEERAREERTIGSIDSEIAAYTRHLPSLRVEGSEERRLAEAEYAKLTQRLGRPKTHKEYLAMQLTAVEQAFGPIDRVRRSRTAEDDLTRSRRTTHAETGGGPVPSNGQTADPIKGLSPDKRKFYERAIERGAYRDWNEVKKELAFVNKRAPRYQRA